MENVDQAIRAQELGADRIELCDRLDLDGITPSDETIDRVLESVQIPVKVMIRPRGGDFVYNSREVEMMIEKIQYCKAKKVPGVVFGVLDEKGGLDLESISLLAKEAAPMEVTIHKAIDLTIDPVEAVRELRSLNNIDSILTSGKAPTADEGKEVIKAMIEAAEDRLEVIVAGRVKHNNLEDLHKKIHAREYHGRNIME